MQATITVNYRHYVRISQPFLYQDGLVGVYTYCREDYPNCNMSPVYLLVARMVRYPTPSTRDIGSLCNPWSQNIVSIQPTGQMTSRQCKVKQRRSMYRRRYW